MNEFLTKKEKEQIEKIINALAVNFWLRPAKDASPLYRDHKTKITFSCSECQSPQKLKEIIEWIYTTKKKDRLNTSGLYIYIEGTSINFTKKEDK